MSVIPVTLASGIAMDIDDAASAIRQYDLSGAPVEWTDSRAEIQTGVGGLIAP
jgi:hypothetical protein